MVGLDVSKALVSCAVMDPVTHQLAQELSVPNTSGGLQQLLASTPPEAPWVLEPTGRYSAVVAACGRAAGRVVLMAPPRQAKSFLAAVRPRAKTDRLDSRGLALYALAVPLRPYPIKTPQREQVDQLLSARRVIARSLASLKQQRPELPYAAALLAGAMQDLQVRREDLDRHLVELTRGNEGLPGAETLDLVPGIGPVIAAAIASCLQGNQFGHPDQFVAYVGLDVRVRDSGQRKGQRTLTKQGNGELRRLLYLAALASLRSRDTTFRQRYERELAKGLSRTAALCAVARKLARLCWSLIRHGTTYDPQRVGRQAPRLSNLHQPAPDP